MTHELKNSIHSYLNAKKAGLKCVLATVVALDGSSYRKPGVFMLIVENGQMTGAVSGGCVEKEVLRQAASVFATGIPKVMTYDGRYRLGCEGILYILIEPFSPDEEFIEAFDKAIASRIPISISSYFRKEVSDNVGFGSEIQFYERRYTFKNEVKLDNESMVFSQTLEPCYRLILVGAEHDAVQLCSFASGMGWEVDVIAHPTEEKQLKDFPGARTLRGIVAEDMDVSQIDEQTAIVLMTHSYVKDLQFLMALEKSRPAYLGLLGPNKRREKLLNEFLEHCPDVEDSFFDHIYGPAGLNVGAETPQEIAIAILAEILAIDRVKVPMSLRDKKDGIHA
jgi:xanthine/CO dehydrogenase XdhC/CoxF family maturation factor